MQSPVSVSNGSRLEKEAIGLVWHHSFVSWKLNHAINVDMRNVDFLQRMHFIREDRVTQGLCGMRMDQTKRGLFRQVSVSIPAALELLCVIMLTILGIDSQAINHMCF